MSIFAIAYQGTCQRQLQTGMFAVCSRLGEVRKKIKIHSCLRDCAKQFYSNSNERVFLGVLVII